MWGSYPPTSSAELQSAVLQGADEDNRPLRVGRRMLCHVVCLLVRPGWQEHWNQTSKLEIRAGKVLKGSGV